MESSVHVGNKIGKDTVKNLVEIVTAIFTEGHKNHMDQETIQAAISMVGNVAAVKNVTITNSVFKGDNVVNMDKEDGE